MRTCLAADCKFGARMWWKKMATSQGKLCQLRGKGNFHWQENINNESCNGAEVADLDFVEGDGGRQIKENENGWSFFSSLL